MLARSPPLPEPLLLLPERGTCDTTNFAEHNDCQYGEKGAWKAGEHNMTHVLDCIAQCRKCNKCNFISYSARFNDCSWFTSCATPLLGNSVSARSFETVRVQSGGSPKESPFAPLLVQLQRAQSSSSAHKCQCPVHSPLPKLMMYNRIGKSGSSWLIDLVKESIRSSRPPQIELMQGSVTNEHLTVAGVQQLQYRIEHERKYPNRSSLFFEQHLEFSRELYAESNAVYLQLVRDPLDRWVSRHYFYHHCFCATKASWCSSKQVEYSQYDVEIMCGVPGGDINLYYARRDKRRRYMVPDSNELVRYFCGHHPICHSTDPSAREASVIIAKARARHTYAWIGLLANLEDSLRLLAHAMPGLISDERATILARAKPQNTAAQHGEGGAAAPNATTVAEIRKELALDYELYDAIQGLFRCRLKTCLADGNVKGTLKQQREISHAEAQEQAIIDTI